MSTRTSIIAFILLIMVGTLLGMFNSGFFQTKKNKDSTLEDVTQIVNQLEFNSDDIKDTAKAIIQSGIMKNDQSISKVEYENYLNYKTVDFIENSSRLDIYKVDQLLDNSVVYSLPRKFIKELNISNFFSSDESACQSNCILVKNNNTYFAFESNVYYLSSFTKNNTLYWIYFVKRTDNYIYAKVLNTVSLKSENIYFTGRNITKISQKGPNSSEYVFGTQGNKSIEVDFKFSRELPGEGFINGEPIGDD